MRTVRLAVVGAGVHSTAILLPSLHMVREIETVALCDIREELARERARQFGFARYYKDYHEMVAREELDGAVVCINAATHPKVSIDLVSAGLDVLVEKPAAITPDEAAKMETAAASAGRFIMVEHNKRHATAVRKARQIAASKDFGKLVMINSTMLGYPYETLFDCMMEWQIHSINLIRAFAGEVRDLQALRCDVSEQRAAIAILMEFESGTVGTAHWGTEGGTNHGLGAGRGCQRLELVGDNARVLAIENDRRLMYFHGNDARVWEPDWSPHAHNSSLVIDGYVGALSHFAQCIRERQTPDPCIGDQVRDLEFVHRVAELLDVTTEWRAVQGHP